MDLVQCVWDAVGKTRAGSRSFSSRQWITSVSHEYLWQVALPMKRRENFLLLKNNDAEFQFFISWEVTRLILWVQLDSEVAYSRPCLFNGPVLKVRFPGKSGHLGLSPTGRQWRRQWRGTAIVELYLSRFFVVFLSHCSLSFFSLSLSLSHPEFSKKLAENCVFGVGPPQDLTSAFWCSGLHDPNLASVPQLVDFLSLTFLGLQHRKAFKSWKHYFSAEWSGTRKDVWDPLTLHRLKQHQISHVWCLPVFMVDDAKFISKIHTVWRKCLIS